VALHTDAIAQVRAEGLVMADGRPLDVDVIVWATGFVVTDFVAPLQVHNPSLDASRTSLTQRLGTEPASTWLGLMKHGYPNLFFVVGPNTGLGSNSIIFMIECQTRAITQIIQRTRAKPAATVQPSQAAEERWYSWVQRRMQSTVWLSGCTNWYITPNKASAAPAPNRIDTLWPSYTWHYWLQTRWLRWADLETATPKRPG
jgi:cation diffusion facilitator CzcD-associated flavoprotein CzcO